MPEIALPYLPRVVVCTPIYGWVPAETMISYAALMVNGCRNGIISGLKVASAAGLAATRNRLVREALELNPTHLLFLDSDMTVPADACQKLLRHQKNIVSGLYFTRRPPFGPILRKRREWSSNSFEPFMDPEPPLKFSEVNYIGFGCVMIAADVFRKCLSASATPDKVRFFAFNNEADEEEGEDIFFCRLMHKMGEKMYVDPECECGHVGTYTVTKDTYKRGCDQQPSLG